MDELRHNRTIKMLKYSFDPRAIKCDLCVTEKDIRKDKR